MSRQMLESQELESEVGVGGAVLFGHGDQWLELVAQGGEVERERECFELFAWIGGCWGR